jgi:hypothetical protein
MTLNEMSNVVVIAFEEDLQPFFVSTMVIVSLVIFDLFLVGMGSCIRYWRHFYTTSCKTKTASNVNVYFLIVKLSNYRTIFVPSGLNRD